MFTRLIAKLNNLSNNMITISKEEYQQDIREAFDTGFKYGQEDTLIKAQQEAYDLGYKQATELCRQQAFKPMYEKMVEEIHETERKKIMEQIKEYYYNEDSE